MDSKHARRSGRECRIIAIKALTAPTITKLFQRQPRRINCEAIRRDGFSQKRLTSEMNIGRLSPAFPVTPPDMRVRIRRFGGLSYRPPVNLGIPSESK